MRTSALPSVNGFGASPDGIGASPDGLGRPFGADEALEPLPAFEGGAAQEPSPVAPNPVRSAFGVIYGLASVAGTAIGAYHGYKRNESVGWAIGWAFLGGLFPIVVVPVAFAQGLGERKRERSWRR